MQFQGIHQSNAFFEIRFFLSGFDSVIHQQVKSKLVSVGAVDVGLYGPDCTVVIVHNLVFDDPICVSARRDGKTVVTSLWVDHSLDVGEPVDHTSIMYRPPKDLNGVPGAKELVMCLTGYQRQDREDIMTMVGLMGAQFSKPLVANKVTHLICYKFEGEKYDLAKKMRKIKLVNHRWLEDCLKAWKILPEEQYSKSGYELEMETEAKDSEEETGEVAGRLAEGSNTNAIPNLQNEIGGTQHKERLPVVSNNHYMKFQIKEEMISDQASKSRNQNEVDQSPRRYIAQDQMDANAESVNDKIAGFLSPNQIRKGLPSTSGNAQKFSDLSGSKKTPERQSSVPMHVEDKLGNINRESCKRLSDSDNGKCSSLDSRKSSLSLQSAGNLDYSNLQTREEKGASAYVGLPNSKELDDSDSGKPSPQSSRRTPGRSSLSSRAVRKLSNSDERLQDKSAEAVEACFSPVVPEKGKLPQVKVLSVDECGPNGVLPQKRKVDGQSNASPKSQKLTTSASKGIDTAEPTTPVSKTLMNSKNVSPNIASHIGDVTVRPSSTDTVAPNVSSIKSKVKSTAASGTLASEILQGIKSTSMADMISPNTSNIATSTSPSIGNKNEGQQNEQQKAVSPVPRDLEVAKSTSPKLNADNQLDNSISKPPRKKTVARKTLGSIPKISKTNVDTQKASFTRHSPKGDEALRSFVEVEENNASSPIAGRLIKVPHAVDAPVHGGSKPLLDSSTEIKDNAGSLDDETEAPPDFDLQNDKSVSNELFHCHPDKAEIAPSSSPKTCEQAVPVAETGKKKQPLVTQKKTFSGKTKKIGLVANKKRNDSNEAEGEKCIVEAVIGEQVACVAGKKRHGTLLSNKSEGDPEKLEEQIKDHVRDGHGTSKGGKHTGKLAGRKRRGTLLLKKPEGVVESEKENEPDSGGDERHTGKLAAKSKLTKGLVKAEKENVLVRDKDKGTSKGGKPSGKLVGKKRRDTLVLNKSEKPIEVGNENELVLDDAEAINSDEEQTEKSVCKSKLTVRKSDENTQGQLNTIEHEPAWFLLSGHRLQRKEFQQLIKRLKGKLCRDSHQWSYQATHLILPDPIRRTEKFFAAAASGRWILKTDYLTASSQAGKFLLEEPYEWHKNGLSEDGAINLQAPRKWRLLREKTGHGAFYGLCVIIYGECIAPPLDTLKRVVKAGDGTILATSPPYARFLTSGIDFAIVSPGMPRVDIWVQEFLRYEIPCVLADYLVEYVCKPGYSLEKHVQYNTHKWAAKSFSKLMSLSEECVIDAAKPENQISSDLACQVCGSSDRGEVMLICGDESGSSGCGIGTHIDCCDPPLEDVPEEDWFCPKCNETRNKTAASAKKAAISKSRC